MRNAVVLNTINRALSQLRTRLYNNRVVARAATLRGQATSTQTCIFHTRCQVSIFFDYKNDHTLIPRYLSAKRGRGSEGVNVCVKASPLYRASASLLPFGTHLCSFIFFPFHLFSSPLSHGGHSSPLPVTVRAIVFIAGRVKTCLLSLTGV